MLVKPMIGLAVGCSGRGVGSGAPVPPHLNLAQRHWLRVDGPAGVPVSGGGRRLQQSGAWPAVRHLAHNGQRHALACHYLQRRQRNGR